jgi:hypothetical protein
MMGVAESCVSTDSSQGFSRGLVKVSVNADEAVSGKDGHVPISLAVPGSTCVINACQSVTPVAISNSSLLIGFEFTFPLGTGVKVIVY